MLAAVFTLLPSMAYAYTLQCVSGFPVEGTDVFIGVNNCSAFGIANIFSGLNCNFQQILNEVIKRMYCGIQFKLAPTLMAVILIYVIVYALMFTMGLAALTAKELATRLIKIALIWSFAMNASWGVGMAFYFLSGGIETIVSWVVQVFFPAMDPRGFFYHLDMTIFNQLTGGLSGAGYAILGFFATMFALMPPVFLLFLTFMISVLSALTRALISYLLGLAAIAFMLSVGPIFVSMALFKTTYTFFDSWLKYLISFALQIVMIFAAVALWLFVMSLFGNFFLDLARMIVPYEKIHAGAGFAFFKNTWGICLSGGQMVNGVMSPNCISGVPAPPSAYSTDSGFITYLSVNLLSLGVVVYAFDALLRMIPDLARQLTGPKFAPQLGGGHGFGAVQMPGFTGIGSMKQTLMTQAMQGGMGAWNNLRSGLGGNLSAEGARAANWYASKKSSSTQKIKNQISKLVQ